MRDPFGRHGSGPRSSPSGCATMCFRRCRPRLRRGPARPPLRVTRPSHAGSGRVPWYVGKAPRSRSSTMLSEAGPLVELGDQPVPDGSVLAQAPPETLSSTLLEFIDRHALLLDPGIVAEVEYPRPFGVGQ